MKYQTQSNPSERPDSIDQLSRISRPQLICSRCFNAGSTHAIDCGHLGKFSDMEFIIDYIIQFLRLYMIDIMYNSVFITQT